LEKIFVSSANSINVKFISSISYVIDIQGRSDGGIYRYIIIPQRKISRGPNHFVHVWDVLKLQ